MFGAARFKGLLRYIYNHLINKIPFNRVRVFFYRKFFRIGKHSTIMMGFCVRKLLDIKVGHTSNINPNCMFDSRGGKIVIGDYVDIAPEVNIWTLEHDPQHSDFITKGGDVIIEDYCWVANRAIILPGVSLGKGAVVATGSVVTKNVPSFAIVGGVPARVIGKRNPVQNPRVPYTPIFI